MPMPALLWVVHVCMLTSTFIVMQTKRVEEKWKIKRVLRYVCVCVERRATTLFLRIHALWWCVIACVCVPHTSVSKSHHHHKRSLCYWLFFKLEFITSFDTNQFQWWMCIVNNCVCFHNTRRMSCLNWNSDLCVQNSATVQRCVAKNIYIHQNQYYLSKWKGVCVSLSLTFGTVLR